MFVLCSVVQDKQQKKLELVLQRRPEEARDSFHRDDIQSALGV
jgi:hypothetical protein